MQVLIAGLATDGLTAKLDRLWVFAQPTEALALVDVISGTTATAVNVPTFTANVGYTGDGATSYIDTNYNPNTQGVKYIRDSASVSGWCVTNRAASPICLTGAMDGTALSDLFTYLVAGNTGLFVRINSGGSVTLTNSGSRGFFTVNRSGAASCQGYYNGASLGTSADASSGVPNVNFWACTGNLNNTLNGPSTDQIAAVAYGGSLTAGDAANLYARLRTYMTAVGVP